MSNPSVNRRDFLKLIGIGASSLGLGIVGPKPMAPAIGRGSLLPTTLVRSNGTSNPKSVMISTDLAAPKA